MGWGKWGKAENSCGRWGEAGERLYGGALWSNYFGNESLEGLMEVDDNIIC